jgi:hypothetical protein
MRFDNNVRRFSSVLTVLLLAVTTLSIIFIFKVLWSVYKSPEIAETEDFQNRYGILVEGLKSSSFIGTYWKLINLVRWLATIGVLLQLRGQPQFQIIMLLIISFAFQALIFT